MSNFRGILNAKRKDNKKGFREPCIDLPRRLDALRRHFLIATVVIIKGRAPGTAHTRNERRSEGDLTYDVVYDKLWEDDEGKMNNSNSA